MEIIKRSAHGYAQDPTKNLGLEVQDGQGNPDVALIVAAFDFHAGCWKQFDFDDQEIARIKNEIVAHLPPQNCKGSVKFKPVLQTA